MPNHPIFANEHNPGQHSTAHRPVEAARQRAVAEGPHPECGRFVRDYDAYRNDEVPNFHQHVFKAPSGARVVVHHITRQVQEEQASKGLRVEPIAPSDRRVLVDGQEMFESAARVYLGQRHGIDL
jgi:hypothetical protein